MTPADPTRATLRALLGGAGVGDPLDGGWRLEGFRPGPEASLLLRDGERELRAWIRRASDDSASFARTERFLIGYRGELLEPDAERTLRALARRLREHEKRVSAARCERLFVRPAATRPLRLSGDTLVLRITTVCNERCPFCNAGPAGDNVVPERDAQFEALAQAARRGADRVAFTGGEPTLVAWLPELLAAATGLGLRTILETNLSAPGAVDWKRFPRPPDELLASFHSSRPATVAALTGLRGTLPAKIEALRGARRAGIKVVLSVVATTLNLSELPELPRWVAANLGPEVGLSLAVTAPIEGGLRSFHLVPRAAATGRILDATLDAASELRVPAHIARVCGLPPCVLPDRPRAFATMHGTPNPEARAHTKSAACARCVHDARCAGVWTAYADAYGMDEFRPVPR